MYNAPVIEAYDDGYFPVAFKGGRGSTYIVGVEVRDVFYPSKVAWSLVKVDMNTTTVAISEISKAMSGSLLVLDGITYAGFDVIDPLHLYASTGKGVIIVQIYPLDLERIECALRKHFYNWQSRYNTIREIYSKMIPVETPWRTIKLYTYGVSPSEAIKVIHGTCIYSPLPEPLRLADKIASSISRALLK
ncbi:MAG: DUF99 family protein [Desulfurococcaceae archaeon]